MPRKRTLSCFSIPSNNSSTFTYNTAYTNLGQLLAQKKASESDEIVVKHFGSEKKKGKLKSSKSDGFIKKTAESAGKLKGRASYESAADYIQIEKLLERYPWYHGEIDRLIAEKMVLGHQGEAETGKFIVRKSRTRTGQHVITFNNNAQATHIQFAFDYKGQCKLKSQCFDTIFDMLEYFRSHPIPVESARHTHVTLAGYVSNLDTPNFKFDVHKSKDESSISTTTTT